MSERGTSDISTAIREHGWLSEIFVSYQGEGSHAGEKHLFVRFAGCNLRCTYCDTPDSLVRVRSCRITWADGREEVRLNPIASHELAACVARMCESDPAISMLALTGGEPLVQCGFLRGWLRAYAPPRPCLLETNAVLPDNLGGVLRHIAVVSADVKLPSNSGEKPFWDAHEAFLRACRNTELYVKIAVDAATDAAEIARAAALVRSVAPQAALYLQPITAGSDNRWLLDRFRLLELVAVAKRRFAATFVRPQIHKLAGLR